MQGDPQVLEVLNEVLTAELTAINQYFLHAKMCEQLGLRPAREQRSAHESIDEMKHADSLIDRDPVPRAVSRTSSGSSPLRIGETVAEQFAVRPRSSSTNAIEPAQSSGCVVRRSR